MADGTTQFKVIPGFEKVEGEVAEIMDAFNFRELGRQVKNLGKQNPIALSFAAAMVGIAAGTLVRRTISGDLR